MQFWLLTLITRLRKIISERWRPSCLHTSGASPQSSASHLLTFLVAQLQFLRAWKLSDLRLYEVFERRLLIWRNPKERNRKQIKKPALFLLHPVYIYIYVETETLFQQVWELLHKIDVPRDESDVTRFHASGRSTVQDKSFEVGDNEKNDDGDDHRKVASPYVAFY